MNELVKVLAGEFTDKAYAHAYLNENANMRIAAQVRALRIENNWSQQQLAEKCGMRQERISKIEMADFESLTLNTLRRLAEAFDVHFPVQFSSIADAVIEIATLTKSDLLCDSREVALKKLAALTTTHYAPARFKTPTQPSRIKVSATGKTPTQPSSIKVSATGSTGSSYPTSARSYETSHHAQ